MSNDSDIRIREALTLHREGNVLEAKAVYKSVFRDDEANADVMGLLAIVAIAQGDRPKAEAAVAAEPRAALQAARPH
jgi:thioredoxin-like negative regulator of GroEL